MTKGGIVNTAAMSSGFPGTLSSAVELSVVFVVTVVVVVVVVTVAFLTVAIES